MEQAYPSKQLLRGRMKEALSGLGEARVAELSRLACVQARNHSAFVNAKVLLAYMALPHEADPALLVQAAREAGKRVAFPYCAPNHALLALEPESPDCFKPDAYGILTPIPEQSKEIAPEELDLVVVPGLAFDAYGGRLGRGAGYYDRFLRKTEAFRMGFCLSLQLLQWIPMDRYDCYMHGLITNSRCYPQF